jgi:hypothetical protein
MEKYKPGTANRAADVPTINAQALPVVRLWLLARSLP